MEGEIAADAPLDYASFQIWPTQNRYEAIVCHDGKIEKLASGLLQQLLVHLPQLKDSEHERSGGHFKLQLPENLKGSTWFSKSTVSRFLHIVAVPDVLENAYAIGDEMSQLEEARKFHLTLYSQGQQDEHRSEDADGHNSNDLEVTSTPENQITSADATKNELLRAMDFRLSALREEMVVAFTQAADGTCSFEQVADLLAFSQYFGAVDMRSFLSKYLELSQKNQHVNLQKEQPNFPEDLENGNKKTKAVTAHPSFPVVKPIKYSASPAKAAQVERHSSTESDDSSNSSPEDQPYPERSRSLIRSASPRRSASPMRRVQIGRSGSRRATALTIKSLSYIPAKIPSNRDAAGDSSDEEAGHPFKKPENNASSMSVKDAISLFERKQRDQSSDLQKKKFPADAPVKSVLRRWSAGMGDPSSQSLSASACESSLETSSNCFAGEEIRKSALEVKPASDLTAETTDPAETIGEDAPQITGEENTSILMENLTDNGSAQASDTNNRVTASADWNRQKADELNLMMMKMMASSKPVKSRSMGAGVSRSQELPSGQRGGFYDHYKKKRDEKLRGENSGKRVEKEDKSKSLQGLLDQRKVDMASKSVSVTGKQDLVSKSRKSQKNPSPPLQPRKESPKSSSPLLQPKKDSSKAVATKKISPKASPLPTTRKSWPSAPSPKTAVSTPNKTPGWISSTGTTAARRKSQSPSPIQSSPKVERSQQKPKNTKGPQNDAKPVLKGQEGKKNRAVTRSANVTEAKALQTSGDGSTVVPSKPSFYNKVTKKGSVVPLESKPFLRKRSGTSPSAGPVKAKVPQLDEPLSSENPIPAEEVVAELSKPTSQKEEEHPISPVSDVTHLQQEAPISIQHNCEDAMNNDQCVSESSGVFRRAMESPEEIQPENESTISPTAWVEIEEHHELPESCDIDTPQIAIPTNIEPVTSSSPRVRHSLSQMLQEDSGEPEIIEWGNAENPPAIVYQKDAAKGFKRLLKFTRKSKGDANATGWSSPSGFSDGEEDAEESKASSKRHADAILRKASLQAKGFGQLSSLGTSYDGGNSSKSTDYIAGHDLPSGQSNTSKYGTQQERHISGAAPSTKSSRSFFSLSTFRSSKSNETKLR